jgi:DNA end-binding protein Ku
MPARAISSGTISFGLVSIPIKLFTATSSHQVHFNMLDKETGSRVKQQYIVPSTGQVIERKAMVKGYEFAKGQYVVFEDEELKKLEAPRSSSMDILEFVPLSSVDLIQVEKTYYLGPDKGGDKAYRLLGEAMNAKDRVAVGRWSARGKEQVVLVRPYGKDGLIIHQLFYSNEVRAFSEIDTGATLTFSDKERELAEKLIQELSSDTFDASKYTDSFSERVKAAVDQKVAGQEITIAPEAPKAQIIDLFEALKKSLADVQEKGGPLAGPKKIEPKNDEAGAAPAKKARAKKAQ